MTPKQYADLYNAMTWTYNGATFKVDVNRYTINTSDSDRIKVVKQGKAALLDALKAAGGKTVTIKGSTCSATSSKGESATLDTDQMDRVYTGKGTPDEIRRALWMATHVGLIGNPPAAGALAPQDYADKYLGTDCSGFAMNFLGLGKQSTIEGLDKAQALIRRKTAAEVAPGDAMISRYVSNGDYHHIALVVSKALRADGLLQVFTVESFGAAMGSFDARYPKDAVIGVSEHNFLLKLEKPGVFHKQKGMSKTEFKTNEDIYFQPAPPLQPLGVYTKP